MSSCDAPTVACARCGARVAAGEWECDACGKHPDGLGALFGESLTDPAPECAPARPRRRDDDTDYGARWFWRVCNKRGR